MTDCAIAGIHSFIGAFLAGLVVPKEGALPNKLAPKIELVVREMLLPLFFANSGIKTNIGALSSGKDWGIAIAITMIGTAGKVLPVYLMTWLFTRQSQRFCVTMGILMNTRGLVELIALNVALQSVR